MAILVPNEGELQMIGIALNNVAQESLYLDLYVNDYTPVEGSTLASFTLASGSGYVRKTLTAGNWTCATLIGVTSATYAQQGWTFAGNAGTVYGAVIHGATSGKVFWAERFTAAEATYNGKTIRYTPYIEFE